MKKIVSQLADVKPYLTKDQSMIYELMHPAQQGNTAQSLAMAVVPPGVTTLRHKHLQSEEIYYVLSGKGRLFLDHENWLVGEGDSVCILPGQCHQIENTGTQDLKIFCCCSPAYSHDDTVLMT